MIWKRARYMSHPIPRRPTAISALSTFGTGTLPGKSALVRCRLASYLQRMRYLDNTTPRHDECSRFPFSRNGSTRTEETLLRSFEINFLTAIKLNKRVLLRSILIILHNAESRPDGSVLRDFGAATAFSRPPHPTKVRCFSVIPAADPF
jgi:hypothetical protein